MVFGLYISGNEYSGKTTVCLGLALKFKEMGLNVGYFKPVGSITSKPVEGTKDEDITLFKELLNLDLDHEVLCPISVRMDYVAQLSKSNTKDLMNKVIQSYKEVSEGKDVVIIESSNLPETLNFKGLSSPDIARKIHALILLVIKADRESVVDRILHYRDYFKQEGSKTLGTVLTMVPPHLKENSYRFEITCIRDFRKTSGNVGSKYFGSHTKSERNKYCGSRRYCRSCGKFRCGCYESCISTRPLHRCR
ncbi:MAG: AAA family ATPase [Candidatus Ranarchaeia archaeon]|jgi:BioD-like phosphotransacetylase family protein